MTHDELMDLANAAVRNGNWIIRADNDGVSPSPDANGFRWNPPGQWTEATDWNEQAECGGGLHGQDNTHGGLICGSRMVFCDTDGPHVAIGDNKVKVHRARILLVNELPSDLKSIDGNLRLYNTQITSLGNLEFVSGYLDLYGTHVNSLGGLKSVGGYLDLYGTQITSLGGLKSVGEDLDLSGTQVESLGNLEFVGRYLYLYDTQITELPAWVDRSNVIGWGYE